MKGRYASAMVVLTRPQGRNEPLARALSDDGIEALCAPVLSIETIVAPSSLPLPAHYDLVVFVSGNAVTHYVKQLTQAGHTLDAWPRRGLIGAVGTATAQAFMQTVPAVNAQILKPAQGEAQDSEALWQILQPRLPEVGKALIVRGQDGREWLGEQLAAAGVQVTRHASYQRCSTAWSDEHVRAMREAAQSGRHIICLLTSAHGVQSFVDNVVRNNLLDDSLAYQYVVIHPRVAGRLQSSLKAVSGKVNSLAYILCQPTDAAMLQAVRSLAFL